jgi:UDP-MurNAc hydroxylase
MNITYPGHANLFVRGTGVNFLCDPWLVGGYVNNASVWLYPPRRLSVEELPKIDFIYISHEHDDHCNILTQNELPQDIPIYILKMRHQNRVLYDRLLEMGKTNIIMLDPWETRQINSNTKITIFPSDEGWVDSSCCIEHDGATLYHGNDNAINEDTQKKIASKFNIDIAFLPYSGFGGFPAIYRFPVEVRDSLAEKKKNDIFEDFIQAVKNLKTKYAVPAAGDLVLVGEDIGWMNYYDRCSPDEVYEWSKDHGIQENILVMKGGDSFDTDHGFIPHPDRDQWSYSLKDQNRFFSTPEVKSEVEKYFSWLHDVHSPSFQEEVLEYFREGLSRYNEIAEMVDSKYLFSVRGTGKMACEVTIDFSDHSVREGFDENYIKMVELPGTVLYRIMRGDFLWSDAYSSGRIAMDRRPPEYYNRDFWYWLYTMDGLDFFNLQGKTSKLDPIPERD